MGLLDSIWAGIIALVGCSGGVEDKSGGLLALCCAEENVLTIVQGKQYHSLNLQHNAFQTQSWTSCLYVSS